MNARHAVILAAFFMAASALGQQHSNHAKGFSPSGSYEFHGLDTVNTFNGNLNVRIPMGQEYSVAPGLSYQFGLSWNSNSWLSRQEGSTYENCCTIAYPSPRSNAGFGWVFSLGRVYKKSGSWTYESPDGADHSFWDVLHPALTDQSATTIGTRPTARICGFVSSMKSSMRMIA
ncbi:MAG TPA: hypothetical protein VGQ76_20330 [Thermoanaerobaculia bacterium]|jgi:hypothetical protein|nr:hypothetical protein [Thermoanaerobaculia bacterium]